MGDKKIQWYNRQRVDVDDMLDQQLYFTSRVSSIFNKVFGDGVISGLEVSDDSDLASQTTQNAFYDTILDTVGDKVFQTFKATANNIQQINLGLAQVGVADGNVTVSVHTLTDPTTPYSSIVSTPIGQVSISAATIGAVFSDTSFDFSAVTAVATAGSLTVNHYYALSVTRSAATSGSIDLYYNTAGGYSYGHVIEYVASTYTTRATWDLYFKVYTAAIQVSTGHAYNSGNPIDITTTERKWSLANTSGIANYITIKYKETETDIENQYRTGLPVYSRLEDSYTISIRTALADIGTDEEVLGSVANTGTFPMTATDLRTMIITTRDARFIILNSEPIKSGLANADCVYWDTTDEQWKKASYTNLPQGVISDITNGSVTLFGQASISTAFTTGPIYMDTNGNLTSTYTFVKIGEIKSGSAILIDIDIAAKQGVYVENMDALYDEFEINSDKVFISLNNIYNKTISFDTWTASGSLITSRYGLAGSGTQNAALSFGGQEPADSSKTEKFNGSIWQNISGAGLTARGLLAGAGIQNATLSFGGNTTGPVGTTQKFDGTTWSAVSATSARYGLGGAGIQNAAISFGGYNSGVVTTTQLFNGSTWSSTDAINTARYGIAGCGIQFAALNFGGSTGVMSALSEKFNTSAWSYTGSLNTARYYLAGSGTQNAAVAYGGYDGAATSVVTEKFNGTTWMTASSLALNTARYTLAGAGTQNKGLSFGGSITFAASVTGATEKFLGEMPFDIYGLIKTNADFIEYKFDENYMYPNDAGDGILTAELLLNENSGISDEEKEHIVELEKLDYGDGVWSTSGSLNIARQYLAGCGTQNSTISFGGDTGAVSGSTETFDGTTWTETESLNTPRSGLTGVGIQNASLSIGGFTTTYSVVSEIFNGTIWAATGNIGTARHGMAAAGVQNAAVAFGGTTDTASAVTEKFNGTNWSTVAGGTLNTARSFLAGAGSQNSALSFGGAAVTASAVTEKFNGAVWKATTSMNEAIYTLAGSGTQGAALSFGGSAATAGITEKFNELVWTVCSQGSGKSRSAGCGTQNAAVCFGGYTTTIVATTQKFNTQTTLPTGVVLATFKYQS